MTIDQINAEIVQLEAHQSRINTEIVQLENRQKQITTDFHRLTGALIAWRKMLAIISETATSVVAPPSTEQPVVAVAPEE